MQEIISKNKKIKVLIVDDSAVVRKLISTVLAKQSDIEVVGTAANGLLGVEFVRKNPPDLILLDVEMPVMDGIEALKTIRKFSAAHRIFIKFYLASLFATATISL